jgi:two-component system, OmpR family, catabolic regulation response regulator CreB
MSRILVVEDELAIAEAVQLALAKVGHSADLLTFGEEALTRLSKKPVGVDLPYELVILDVGLPDLSGFEVCRRLRLLYSSMQLPVLFLTAHNDEIDRVLGLELGGGDYLTKPFSLRELVTRVRLLLGRRSSGTQEHMIGRAETEGQAQAAQFSTAAETKHAKLDTHLEFEWNELEAWVSFRSQNISLTITEYKLLLAFLGRPKQVFSRQQLLDLCRGETHPSGERTIDTHVKGLRAKLREHSPDADIIITHRGLGYSSK